MKTTIDSAGRLVIPKRIREQAGLTPGAEIEVRYCNGHVEVEVAEGFVRLERRGHFLVAVSDDPHAVLTNEMVQQTIEDIRNEREASILNPGRDS